MKRSVAQGMGKGRGASMPSLVTPPSSDLPVSSYLETEHYPRGFLWRLYYTGLID